MLQLCQGAHTIILPVNLTLKIVFLYYKSGKYGNTYLGWLLVVIDSFSNIHLKQDSQSLHCLCICFTKSYFPLNF